MGIRQRGSLEAGKPTVLPETWEKRTTPYRQKPQGQTKDILISKTVKRKEGPKGLLFFFVWQKGSSRRPHSAAG
jgi:hypothetical protein